MKHSTAVWQCTPKSRATTRARHSPRGRAKVSTPRPLLRRHRRRTRSLPRGLGRPPPFPSRPRARGTSYPAFPRLARSRWRRPFLPRLGRRPVTHEVRRQAVGLAGRSRLVRGLDRLRDDARCLFWAARCWCWCCCRYARTRRRSCCLRRRRVAVRGCTLVAAPRLSLRLAPPAAAAASAPTGVTPVLSP